MTDTVKERIKFDQFAREVISIEQNAIMALHNRIDFNFQHACELLLNCKGNAVIIGMGKSGHIARKIAATMASTGTKAFFVHPAEACHGDSGMIGAQDVVLAISYSGETEEVINLLPLIRHLKTPLIALTGNPNSTLSQAAQSNLNVRVEQEACPLGLAPTASTTATLVMGDAIAISLLKARGFNATDFARFHPSGALGKRLLMSVGDIMHAGADIPSVAPNCTIARALVEITKKRLGMTVVVDVQGVLLGIYTDGDLRRTLDQNHDIHNTPIEKVMTKKCTTVIASMLATDALTIMRGKAIPSLPVVDNHNVPVGIVHMHDLLRAGVI